MRLRRPFDLEIDYCRHMMSWLLFLEPPKSLLQIGLGAAALTKFVLYKMPATEVTVIEPSHAVVQAAHAAFALPRDHANLYLIEEEGEAVLDGLANRVSKRSRRPRYGVIQVDTYDQFARGPVCESEKFYRDCYDTMDPLGSVLVVNLFGEHASYQRNLERIRLVFASRVLELPPVEAGNVIVLAFRGPAFQITAEQLYARANQIRLLYGLKAKGWVDSLKGNVVSTA